jgi:ornithine decarboxylase
MNAQYIIRVRAEEVYSVMKFNRKFGAWRPDVLNMLDYIKENQLVLKGFSYHVGSKCSNMKAHYNTIRMIDEQYIQYCHANHCIIDIGGGFEHEDQLLELHNELTKLNILDKFASKNINLIAEPGRLFSQGAVELYTKVIALREIYIETELVLHITINDSVYHSFQGKLFDHQVFVPIPLYVSEQEEWVKCVIYGQTCDSIDMIVEDIRLPYPKLNEVFKFENMGAYSFASAEGNFNGFNCAELVQ